MAMTSSRTLTGCHGKGLSPTDCILRIYHGYDVITYTDWVSWEGTDCILMIGVYSSQEKVGKGYCKPGFLLRYILECLRTRNISVSELCS